MTILEARQVKREINTKSGVALKILESVDLQVNKGQSVAIQGASGSGKSTLLGLLAGLDIPQTGSIKIDGTDITLLDEDQRALLRANKVGFVFQSFYLVDDLTALENVALPLELFGHQRPFEKAAKWLTKLGLSDRAEHFPKQLSGGEQQRVALCRAFAVEPSLLFADEPTANLDTNTANTVLDHLFELQQECNTTMIIATHDSQLAKRCDRIFRLQSGQLIEGSSV